MMHGLVGVGVAASLALPVLVPGGYWVGTLLLAMLGVVALPIRSWLGSRRIHSIGHRGRCLAAMLLLFSAVQWAMLSLHGELTATMNLVWPAVLAVLVLVACHTWLPRLMWLWFGLAMGGTISGAWAFWQIMDGGRRANGHDPLHAILYGNLSLLTGVLCLAGIGWALSRPRRSVWLVLLAMGAFGGLLASLLSGTRGGWISLPLIMLVFHQGFSRRWPKWQQVALWLGTSLVMMGLYAIPQTGVQQRVGLLVAEVERYAAGERIDPGSLSTRLEMWRGAWQLIQEEPLLGRGAGEYHAAMRTLAEAGELGSGVMEHTHAHNDLLDAWAKRGLPGLFSIIALYLLPLWLFRGGLGHPDRARRALAVSGMLLPVTFFDFGLTYSFFAYPVGIAVYTGWLVVLWTLYRHTPLNSVRCRHVHV